MLRRLAGKSDDKELAFPIIADMDRSLVYQLGMLDPEERDSENLPLPARALIILQGTTVKLTILYPATTGRNFEEIFRVLTSMQLTANNGLATPVNWKQGERVIVGPKVPISVATELTPGNETIPDREIRFGSLDFGLSTEGAKRIQCS